MISAFSCFFAFLGSSLEFNQVLANKRYSARAIARPMSKMLVILSASMAARDFAPRKWGARYFQTFSTTRVEITPVKMQMMPTIISGL
jgi:hypothetical protein